MRGSAFTANEFNNINNRDGTLRHWEQRRKHSDAPARAYLQVIAQSPQTVAAFLQSGA
jgi:DNA-binding transcriptional regulator YiaG